MDRKLSRQRGAISKNAIIPLVLTAVIAVGATYYAGVETPEGIVENIARALNETKGESTGGTRFEEARAEGARVIARYTVLDGWKDNVSDELLAVMPENPGTKEFAEMLAENTGYVQCEDIEEARGMEIIFVTEYANEAGELIARAEQDMKQC